MSKLDLGLIGNSRTSALVNKDARIVWWCYPHFDSNPLCCSLLRSEEKAQAADAFGFIDLIFDGSHTVRQHYQRNSAILQTRLQDAAGNVVDVTDFAPRFYLHGRMFAPAMLVRVIRRVAGRPRIGLRVRPAITTWSPFLGGAGNCAAVKSSASRITLHAGQRQDGMFLFLFT